jgi:hypothetical protein
LIERCVFVDNSADSGGAIMVWNAATITDCVFVGNTASMGWGYGGGIAIFGTARVTNCAFVDCSANVGGGVCLGLHVDAALLNCTFCSNRAVTGGGIGLYEAEALELTNTIIAFSTQGKAIAGNGSKILSHCDLFGNAGGDWVGDLASQLGVNGNICADPLLADAGSGDVHLCFDSPCRDAGDSNAPGLAAADFEGDPRIALGTIDMGADEFWYHLYCTGDPVPGGTITVKTVGGPGMPVLLALGSGIQDPPIPTPYGDLFLQFPLLGNWPLGNIPSDGILPIPAMVPPTWVPGDAHPFQALVGQIGGPMSRLTNLMRVLVLY